MSASVSIQENLARVEATIETACQRVGRERAEVTLVAVSKTRPPAEIEAVYRCGVRHFGENRIEEAEAKLPGLRDVFADDPPTWHLIGHVQSRKAQRAVQVADMIHSVDSVRLGARLDRHAKALGVRLPILLELNVSGEGSKDGFVAWDDGSWPDLVAQVMAFENMVFLDVRGLMTMAPIVADPQQARPVFQRLLRCRDRLRAEAPYSRWDALSMGMTDDYAVAIEEGATIVRIGRAIFGPRTP